MPTRFSPIDTVKSLAEEVQAFTLRFSAEDPDVDWATIGSFRHLAKRFVCACKLINDPGIKNLLSDANTEIESPPETSDLHALLVTAAGYVCQLPNHVPPTTYSQTVNFVAPEVIDHLASSRHPNFDTGKLVQFCIELNSSYVNQNVIATALLVRAILNHVPPVFGHTTFAQVVSNSGRSLKPILEVLENSARPVADLHTHLPIRKKEQLPTFAQIDPFRPAIENLLQEVVSRLQSIGG